MSERELVPHLPALLAALEQAGIGVAMVDAQRGGTLDRWYVNSAACALLGYSTDESTSIAMMELVVPSERPRILEMLVLFSSGLPPPAILETVLLHRDGRSIPAELRLTSSPIAGGNVVIILVRDLERHHAQAIRLEDDRVAVVGALAAGIGHEINNPLTYLLLHLRNLRRSLDAWVPAENQAMVHRMLDEASTGAERIRQIVRAFMTFAQPPGLTPVDVDMFAVTQAALRLVSPAIEPRARVIADLSPVASVRGDEARLGQAVLTMLLFAGADFATDDAAINQVTVSVKERDRTITVEVADNGQDLPSESAARTFHPSFTPRTASMGGSVGLGVPRAIAAAMGGSLALVARPGGGSIVTLRLPAAG